MGTMDDVGPRIRKNHAPQKPRAGRRRSAHTVAPNSTTITVKGAQTSPNESTKRQS